MFAMLTTVISLPVSGLVIGTANAAEPLRLEQGLSSVLPIAWSKNGEAHAGIPPEQLPGNLVGARCSRLVIVPLQTRSARAASA